MNKQNKIIVGVVALVLALTIGYAVFTQSLNIGGTAKAEGNLDIVFSEVGEISPHGTNTPTATITEKGRKLELSEITLDYPTAYVDIPVTIINNGTVDGVLESITVENLETDDIKVTINGIEDNQIVKMYKANDDTTKVKATVRVEWLDKTDTKTESVRDIVVTLNAKQLVKGVVNTSATSSSLAANCTKFTKKDTYEIGDVISFCNNDAEYTDSNGDTAKGKSEDFYVIKDNGDTVTALAKYNLMVGNGVDSSDVNCGLQAISDSLSRSFNNVVFAEKKESNKDVNGNYLGYWASASNLDKPISKYGDNYPAYIYDDNSLVKQYVDGYVNKLKTNYGKKSITGRLGEYNELKEFAYDGKTEMPWAAGDYWLGSAYNYNIIYSFNIENDILREVEFYFNSGLRPVITINKSEI